MKRAIAAALLLCFAAPFAQADVFNITPIPLPLAIASGGTGTATPGLVGGTNVTITGSWPNQTINSSAGGSSTGFGVDGGASSVTVTTTGTVANGTRLEKIGTLSGAITRTLPAISAVSPDTCIRFEDAGANVTGTNTLTITANVADGINNGAGGSSTPAYGTSGLGVTPCVSATHNWNIDGSQLPALSTGNIYVGSASGLPAASTAIPSGVTATTQTAGDNSTKVATTAYLDQTTGTSGHKLPYLDGTNTWSGPQTFGSVIGSINTQSGTTYTLAASDCGKTILFTSASAITLTTLNSLPAGCSIAVEQGGAGQVTVTAGASATQHSAHSFTKTFGQFAIIGLFVDTNAGSAADFIITGDGA